MRFIELGLYTIRLKFRCEVTFVVIRKIIIIIPFLIDVFVILLLIIFQWFTLSFFNWMSFVISSDHFLFFNFFASWLLEIQMFSYELQSHFSFAKYGFLLEFALLFFYHFSIHFIKSYQHNYCLYFLFIVFMYVSISYRLFLFAFIKLLIIIYLFIYLLIIHWGIHLTYLFETYSVTPINK